MQRVLKGCGFFILIAFFVPFVAFGQVDFDRTVTFGDSLTHNDLLWIYYGRPADLYLEDPNECVFDKGSAPNDLLSNYAVAGSESGHVEAQVDLYFFFRWLGVEDPPSTIGFEVGGNDILNNKDLLKASAPGVNPAADAVINDITSNMSKALWKIFNGTRPTCRIILWTLPDVTRTVSLWGSLSQTEISNLRAHTERVNDKIRLLTKHPRFAVVDIYSFMAGLVTNPPVILGHPLNPPPANGWYDDLFADEIHPTAVTNAVIANEIIAVINAKWNVAIPFYSEHELADRAHIPYYILRN